MSDYTPDPDLDLVIERTIAVAPERVWDAWTQPELIKQWFTPAPYKTVGCEIDLRPGGRFNTTMESPEGGQYPNTGCIVDMEPGRRLVFTSVLSEGFRPAAPVNGAEDLAFTGRITMEPTGDGGTRYKATVMHPDEATQKRHAEMGFYDGWGAALDQLVALLS
jgi:uncharacterized protein YndB with AHSA1/START domain